MTTPDLFAPGETSPPRPPAADPVVGLTVALPALCRCGQTALAVIGPGRGPHAAEMRCAKCEQHRGWVARETCRFLNETIARFGCPTMPIKIRLGRAADDAADGGDDGRPLH